MARIVRLEAENIKRLRAISIEPDGTMVVIGGKNGQGKSSTLDSIWYALGGKDAMPNEPLRKGEVSGFSRLTLDNGIVITRTVKANKTELRVESDTVKTFTSPQAMLDAMVGSISFDPMEFSRMKAAQQLATLRDLVGLDTTEIDAERENTYNERTRVNTAVKQLESQLAGIQDHGSKVPKEEVSVKELMVSLTAAEAVVDAHEEAQKELARIDGEIAKGEALIEEYTAKIKALKESLTKGRAARAKQAKKVEGVELPDVESLRVRISEADGINAKVRDMKARADLKDKLARGRAKQAELNDAIASIDERKREMVESAKFPVEGLSFGDGCVRFNDIPLDQCSDAERVRISVGIALAMSPELPVLLIRNGSLLDEDSFAMVAEMAEAAGAQVWIETVSTDAKKCTVIIEDGAVK